MKGLSILGSTGSIGTNVLRVVDAFPGRCEVVGLAAGGHVEALAEQVARHRPRVVSVGDPAGLERLAGLVDLSGVRAVSGRDGMVEVATRPEACRTSHVVVEAPVAARTMNEVTELIVFRGALTNDAARLAVGFPGFDIDPLCRVERGDDDIADRGRALGVIMLARAFEPNLPERVRQRGVLQRCEGGPIHQRSP